MKNDKTREVGMFKLIWKNLWARRRKNGWLLAELILVSIISWVVLDPVIVVTHDRNIPLGYDAERLCLISLGALQPQAPGYDAEAQDSATLVDNYYNLVRYVKDFDGVESATPVLGFCYPNSSGSSNSQLFAEGDTIPLSIMMIQFLPHTNFFDTYGFRSGKGRTLGQLSDYAYAPNDIVLTENAAEQLFHTKDAHGKRCVSRDHGDTLYMPVVGTIGAMKMYSEWRPVPVAFMPMLTIDTSYIPESAHILVRLKEGVSMERFLHDFRPWMVKEMRRGNLFARSVRSYEQILLMLREDSTQASLEDMLKADLANKGRMNIYRIVIQGTRAPELLLLPERLKSFGYVTEVLNESKPSYDLEALQKKYSGTLIGDYISYFLEKDRNAVEEKALYYGLQALLETSR